MSTSRLEKFIYAICSMEVSDLPAPLSRIEKLWNCLITGETPDFEPLSRNEKYLMAMIGSYDISNLPAPMSRGEKLLYKIAVGETDLSDVPGYLSRYEELLKYLIENGGISGGDFEYVLYTLNQSLYTLYTTAEKPVKSAILMGNTDYKSVDWITNFHYQHGLELTSGKVGYIERDVRCSTCVDINENRRFILKASSNIDISIVTADENNNVIKDYLWFVTTADETRFTVEDNCKFLYLNFRKKDLSAFTSESEVINSGLTVKEQNLVSVKMPILKTTGKNLFDINKYPFQDGITYNYATGDKMGGRKNMTTADMIPIESNKQYSFNAFIENLSILGEVSAFYFDKDKKYIKRDVIANNDKLMRTTPENTSFVSFTLCSNNSTFLNGEKSMLVYGDIIPTTYEPYKSNILTVNEPVELRGIGDMQDTLDCLTGEMTERIGEDVLDGSQDWNSGGTANWNNDGNTIGFYIKYHETKNNIGYSDKLPLMSDIKKNDTECFYINSTQNWIGIRLLKSKLSELTGKGLKAYLQSNPVTIQYQLKTESIKTVDLTTIDQDNQPTKLGTFENVTHVSLESDGLIPEVEMEVATNLLEDTVFNLTNTFNTLYPTAAKPVMNGTLYGQTLVNISPLSGEITIKPNSIQFIESSFIQQNKTFTFMFNCTSAPSTGSVELRQVFGDTALKIENINVTKGYNKFKVTTINKELNKFRFKNDSTSETDFVFNNLLIIEGDYTNIDIPYFEGMQSVQMPVLTTIGKNLFHSDIQVFNFDNYIRTGNDINTACDTELKPSTTYTLSWNGSNTDGRITLYSNGVKTNYIDVGWYKSSVTFTTSEVEDGFSFYTRLSTDSSLTSDMNFNVQLEEGSTATPYEPYKSNTLSTPSDLVLRKVGEVKDEVNVMTGEVTECIDEFILNGSEYWDIVNDTFRTSVINNKVIKLETQADRDKIVISCDRYPSKTYNDPWAGVSSNFISLTVGKAIVINNRNFTDVKDFKQYLSQNPLTIKFVLATPTTKTVDLSVVNQDGNETKLRTFDDTTHVLLDSEGLVPTASLTVRTKIPSASSTSLLMDDISTEQQQLETTVDEQSNNVDATMIATTEIFEETL